MITARNSLILLVVTLASVGGFSSHALAADDLWQGDTSTNWATTTNWFVLPGGQAFVPRGNGGFNQRAIIGTDNSNGVLAGTAELSTLLATNNQTIHGLYLGTRQRDFTLAGAPFVNPAPAEGALTGSLTISGATTVLNNAGTPTLPHTTSGADGRILVGQDGRGYLTMLGGTLTGQALIVGGEDISTGNGTSLVDLRGSSTLTVNGPSNFGRRLRVEGPSVNFSSSTQLTFETTNTYTAAITSATAHSPLKVTTALEKASVAGNLNVEFSGAGATRDPITSLGTKWSLLDVNSLATDAIDGNFTNVAPDGSIAVSGLDEAHAPPSCGDNGETNPCGAQYFVRKRATGGHTVMELSYEQVLILTVDRGTGNMSIRNPYSGDISIDTYSISSDRGSMKNTFTGLGVSTPLAGSWAKPAGNNANVISDVKVPDTTPPITAEDAYPLLTVPSVSIGSGFDRLAVASDVGNFGFSGEDLVFTYGGPSTDDVPLIGHVEYVGTKFYNNLVLRVNPSSGVARLKNDSQETLVFDGFEITSTAAALNNAGFTAVTGGTGTWQTDAEGTTGLSQVNFAGARTLMPGQEISIGDISTLVDPFATKTAKAGVSMRFILAESLEPTSGSADGDYNADGVVNALDYTVWRNNLNDPTEADINNNGDGVNGVDEADFTLWKASYGNVGGGVEPETEFRIGSVFFDSTLAPGGGGLAAIPEPATASLMIFGAAGMLFRRRRSKVTGHFRSVSDSQVAEPREEQTRVGVQTMVNPRRIRFVAAMFVVASMLIASSAQAATGGIPITNFDFELPGPLGEKVIAFDDLGVPNGAIPGWTFVGPGVSTFPGDDAPGDSGTEGGGNPGNEMILSTLDGKVYQTAPGHAIINPVANQQYKIGFDAHRIFETYVPMSTGLDGFRLTSRVFYGAYPGTTLATINVTDINSAHYEFLFPSGSPALTPAIGQSLGIEFDTTSIEYSIAEDVGNTIRNVAESWAGIDNVVFELTGILAGDLNGDGVVNITDGNNLRPNLQGYTPYEATGELTGDNVVNLNDFRVLKNLIAAAGSGSGGGGIAGVPVVPEPASGMLALFGLMGVALASARRRFGAKVTKLVAVVAVSAAILEATPASADVLAYDPFLIGATPSAGQYIQTTFTGEPPVASNPLAGQNPNVGSFFSGPWTTVSPGNAVQAPTLQYLTTPSQGGSANGYGRAQRALADPWDNDTVGTFYMGMQVNFGTLAAAGVGNMGYRAIEFFPPNEVPDENRIGDIGYNQFFSNLGAAQQAAATAKMQVNWNFDGVAHAVIQKAPQSYNADGLNHLIVLKFELRGAEDEAGDTVSLFYDPKTPVEGAPNNIADGIDFVLGYIGLASFRNGELTDGPSTVLDEIRVGTTFADVLPPDLPIPGDVNDDDVVDILDYNIIFANMNIPGGQTLGQGDVDGDGKVTIGDYRFWKERRTLAHAGGGGLAGAPAVGVPEPSTLALVSATTFLALGAARRCRPR